MSILDTDSWRYQKASAHIYDNTHDNTLEFYPAGYTQKFIRKVVGKDYCEEVRRQEFFKRLYDHAEHIGKADAIFPFKGYEYKIELVPEPDNRYDIYAMKVVFSTPNENIKYWNDYSIGYVPAKINQKILINLEMISDIAIHSVSDCLNDRFYCARLAVGYDGKTFPKELHPDMKRFKDLI